MKEALRLIRSGEHVGDTGPDPRRHPRVVSQRMVRRVVPS